jgi:hypothetical protein
VCIPNLFKLTSLAAHELRHRRQFQKREFNLIQHSSLLLFKAIGAAPNIFLIAAAIFLVQALGEIFMGQGAHLLFQAAKSLGVYAAIGAAIGITQHYQNRSIGQFFLSLFMPGLRMYQINFEERQARQAQRSCVSSFHSPFRVLLREVGGDVAVCFNKEQQLWLFPEEPNIQFSDVSRDIKIGKVVLGRVWEKRER